MSGYPQSGGNSESRGTVPRPCGITVLIVVDGLIGFGERDFSIVELIATLRSSVIPWIEFDVRLAHRSKDQDETFPQDQYMPCFKFTEALLSGVDEVWFFGFASEGDHLALDDAELQLVSRFMEEGGVFAAGDHEDLGNALCARIPRVRSMRKWFWPLGGPNGEPVAPVGRGRPGHPEEATTRHDTLREGSDTGYQFDDQSDSTPQEIEPRIYKRRGLPKRSYTHPLLCGPKSAIVDFPDHAHEGECYVDDDLTKELCFGGFTTVEYPTVGTNRHAPEVIAWATVIGGHPTSGVCVDGVMVEPDLPPVKPKKFGLLGAYDGHRVGIGRVVVDSSFHHFFRINLLGTSSGLTAEKMKGFKATCAGEEVLEGIKSYYRNIGLWIAGPERQLQIVDSALWWAASQDELLQCATGNNRGPEALRQTGQVTRAVLGRIVSLDLVDAMAVLALKSLSNSHGLGRFFRFLDPWQDEAGYSGEEQLPESDALIEFVLGGAVEELAKTSTAKGRLETEPVLYSLRRSVLAGAEMGLLLFLAHLENQHRRIELFLRSAKDVDV
jgi:hypothetical protein